MHIQHAKLVLQLGLEIEGNDGHLCQTCKRELNEEESEVFDNLVELEQHINKETFLALVYIAGHVQRCDNHEYEDTCAYHELYGEYLDTLNRGGLQIPTDTLVQWSTFCFIFFRQLSGSICRTFCIEKFMLIAETFHFSVTKRQCRVLPNILLKNHSVLCSPKSRKETGLKVLKLSCELWVILIFLLLYILLVHGVDVDGISFKKGARCSVLAKKPIFMEGRREACCVCVCGGGGGWCQWSSLLSDNEIPYTIGHKQKPLSPLGLPIYKDPLVLRGLGPSV